MRCAATLLLLCAALATGCASKTGPEAEPDRPVSTTRPSASPSASPTESPSYVGGELRECFIPATEVAVSQVTLKGAGLRLATARFGARADTVLVLLHQTNTTRCGWGGFGIAAVRAGMAALAPDLCGYGDSRCGQRFLRDPAPQVRLAVAFARERMKARHVVVVGASMGGSQTVRAVAAGVAADAFVDVSGPSSWDGVDLIDLADRVRAPGLVIMADSEAPQAMQDAEALAQATGAQFLGAPSGHGVDLLNDDQTLELLPLGREVLDFAASVS
jgi:pimeloyl-ACP methyl ester carboxylesterase